MTERLCNKKVVVASDLHGHYQPLEKMLRHYGDSPDRYILNGDLLGAGPSTAKVLDIASAIDADINIGNWELYLLAGLLHEDKEIQRQIQDAVRVFGEEKGVLDAITGSYGINTKIVGHSEKIKRLQEAMLVRGHLQMLARAAMFCETDDFIAIHAGLTGDSWSEQQEYLAEARDIFDEPRQIVDDAQFTLSRRPEAFEATDKVVVTGHSHIVPGPRITAGGKRVRLASRLELGEPLHVWQSWNGQVKGFEQK